MTSEGALVGEGIPRKNGREKKYVKRLRAFRTSHSSLVVPLETAAQEGLYYGGGESSLPRTESASYTSKLRAKCNDMNKASGIHALHRQCSIHDLFKVKRHFFV